MIYYNPSGRFFLPSGVTNTDSFLYSVRDRSNSLAAVSVTVVGVLSRPAIIITNIAVQTNGYVRLLHNGAMKDIRFWFRKTSSIGRCVVRPP